MSQTNHNSIQVVLFNSNKPTQMKNNKATNKTRIYVNVKHIS